MRDEGFEKELKLVSKLPAKQAKAHVMQKFAESPADAVRLLNTLPESSVKRILGQMKTPEELQIMHELVKWDPQFDWTHKFYHTNNWVAVAARHIAQITSVHNTTACR